MSCFMPLFMLALSIHAVKIKDIEDIYKIVEESPGYKLTTVMPKLQENPSDSSIVYIAYTPTELIVYSKNYQKGISANSRRRDAVAMVKGQEDNIAIIIAPYGKGNDVYYIAVNPLGAIYDKMISIFGETEWDGNVKALTEETEYGWSALLIIPFNALNYGEVVWGIQICRVISKKGEMQFLFPTTSLNYIEDIAEMKLDFNYIKKDKNFNFYVMPSVRFSQEDKTNKFTWGGTIRFKQGSKSVLDITYHPDFSEVDVDMFKFDLRRLPIDYPEKRIFFTEGSNYLSMPFPLLRTRNFEKPLWGVKFFTATEKVSLISLFINDASLGNATIIRTTYNPFSSTKIGFYLMNSEIGYNLSSMDFINYYEKLKLSFSLQASKRLDNNKNLYYVAFERYEKPGLSLGVSYTSIDSFIISPFNYILIDFEGIKQVQSFLHYRYDKSSYTFMPSFIYNFIQNKFNSENIYKNYGFFVYLQTTKFPIILFSNIGASFDGMYYLKDLGFENTSSFTYSTSIGYFLSSWNRMIINYNFGNYLGSKLRNYFVDLRFSFCKIFNLGFSFNLINSLYDSLIVFENYGELNFHRNFIFKPYILYKVDNINKIEGKPKKNLLFNAVFIFEPRYLTGFYICLGKEYNIENSKFIETYDKIMIKIRTNFSM